MPNKAEQRVGGTKEERAQRDGRVVARDGKKSEGRLRSCMCRFITHWTLIYTNRLFTRYGK